ncbi:MAG TPA: DnaJ domain-containing protein [Humisphaera sp.]|jgi:molecular chaperone DnaJ|nr:DnaJ domain-containing protein [Humisphaera sp.]
MPSSITHDYYALLGIHAGADDDELRIAWRKLAAQWHPDRAGAEATAKFQQLSAAYAVLSDPIARAAYDRRYRAAYPKAADSPRSSATTTKSPTRSSRPPVPGIMLSRLSGPLASLIACGAVRIEEDGGITLVLSEADAAQGGMASISMRVEVHCPDCSKQNSSGRCARCGGTRAVEELFSAWLAIHPGVADGEVLTPSAELPGMIEPMRFRVAIRHQNRNAPYTPI